MLSIQSSKAVNTWLGRWYRFSRSLRPWFAGECLICEQPVQGDWDLCLSCQQALPRHEEKKEDDALAFDALLTPYVYALPMNRLLLRFKSQAQRTAGSLLVDLLLAELQSQPALWQADALVAIPAQKDRLRKRGINPPAWLAQRLAWQLEYPFHPQWLRRCRTLVSQQALNRKQRWLNPQGAFIASQEVEGKKLLLVDDVVTTGATCHWAARALKEKGAASVTVIAACRTPF